MKNQFILINFIFILLNLSCNHHNKNGNIEKKSTETSQRKKIEKIQLTEQTRGSRSTVTFTPTSKTDSFNGEISNSPMSSSEWERILSKAAALDLSKISTYPSPTTGRYSDQAMEATFIITSNGTAYTSASFDSGNPPKELEALYNEIQPQKKTFKKKP
ncbi:hypothetical protein H5J24_18750 [Chryseobacterium capnotolerans]|uniref:hypothetical protein n=1 Tax=Chryseobacterium TaxID=59732 RepID=UPI00083A6B75|nr:MULTISPECIES: hypothetical protein [Chryseobacterium]UHO37666.1 hypothetical protein H5J24_18750 [Chryseobacterium capnotolerans]